MTPPTLAHIVCNYQKQAVRVAYWEHGDPHSAHTIICVHGVTRQGRDFDVLAQALISDAQQRGVAVPRIICPDMPGRGGSTWLSNPNDYQVPVYVQIMVQFLAQLQQQNSIQQLDWVGTSMGGLIGMGLAALQSTAAWPLAVPLRHMVLNDVGPEIAWSSIERIGHFVADTGHFATLEQGLAAAQQRALSFGPHTAAQWEQLNRPMLVPHPEGGWRLHYDAGIAQAFYNGSPEVFAEGTRMLWQIFEGIPTPILVLRGADSDLLTAQAARQMVTRGQHVQLVEFAGVGHAPALMQPDQTAAIAQFLR